jgi:hypothetical protein
MKTFYYDVHVFHSRKNGFSVVVKSETELSDEEAIALALKQEKIDSEDADSVDYVEEIDKETYDVMCN